MASDELERLVRIACEEAVKLTRTEAADVLEATLIWSAKRRMSGTYLEAYIAGVSDAVKVLRGETGE